MKKFVIILLAACLLLGCGVGYYSALQNQKGSGEPVALYDPENVTGDAVELQNEPAEGVEETEGTEETALPELKAIDYEAIRALYPLDAVVGDVDGREVTWGDYFYWLSSMGMQIESYLSTMALYGQSLDWNDKLYDDSDQTLAEYVVEMAQDYLRQLCVVEAVADENGAVLTAEDEAALAEELKANIVEYCGEGASEDDFFAYLEENYLSRGMYERINRFERLYTNTFKALYGEGGEKIPAEDAVRYLEDNDYLCAAHILFMTVDDNFEPLDEAAIAQKLADAEAVSAELRAITDPQKRAERFAVLKEKYCEDPGGEVYPDGYLFVAGQMVTEFEDGIKALEDYEVSEPVLTGYGYHVIMRLPLSAEMTIFNADGDARALCADAQFNALLSERIDQSVLTLTDDLAAFDLTDYLV